ncbi:hypothetical protein BPA30113_06517 [Burkholderia paludis]|uniref:Uncharacterized protein n=1 Tax=Burkholderia paludis TaxID=1506587 RepID=A0A6P2RNW9_9BURK|nr:hypothetical protein LMG30113_06010 [Burkholderia paludis]VWC34870.1 hypothetical protein BPA30113_06517 [Burkholderia paludis]
MIMNRICIHVNIADLSHKSGVFCRLQLLLSDDVDSVASRYKSVSECTPDIRWPRFPVSGVNIAVARGWASVARLHFCDRRLNQNDAQAGTSVMPTDS